MRIKMAVFAGLIAMTGVAYWVISRTAGPGSDSSPSTGSLANAGDGASTAVDPHVFALADSAGRMVDLASLRGKPVLLNFWATWCPPCIEELPSLLRFADRAGRDLGVQTVAVSSDESWRPIEGLFRGKKLWPRSGLPLTILLDSGGAVAVSYGTLKYPESYFIDRGFKVVRKFIGPQDWDSQEIVKWVTEHSK